MNGAISETEVKSPIALKWKIPVARLIELKDKPGEFLTSDSFDASNISGVKYYAKIYPNGKEKEKSGETWIFLFLSLPREMMIKADATISVESADFRGVLKVIFRTSDYGWGKKCCKTDKLFNSKKGFIVDDVLTIKLDGIIATNKTETKKEEEISDDLCVKLWEQEETKDFVIVVDGKEIRAHKVILATRSPVFARMLQSGMKEAEEGKVVIEDFTFDIVEKSVKSCYHSSLVGEATFENKIKMLQFYDKYDIQPLKNKLEDQLIATMDSSNVCLLTNCALLTNARKLEKKCAEFLDECLKLTKPIADFDLLDKEFALNIMKNAFYPVSTN